MSFNIKVGVAQIILQLWEESHPKKFEILTFSVPICGSKDNIEERFSLQTSM
jgi:hypothetical protein